MIPCARRPREGPAVAQVAAALACAFALALACRPLAQKPSSPAELLPAAAASRGQEVLAEPDPTARAAALAALVRDVGPASADFLLALLERDDSPRVRERIVREIAAVESPATRAALERHAVSDPDAAVSLRALELLHRRDLSALVRILDTRLAAQPASAPGAARLREAQDRWLSLARGALVPGFLREAPPVFAAAPSDRGVRVVAFGDFGSGKPGQRSVADALVRYQAQRPADLGITLGDNFYVDGMQSPRDPRFRTLWSDLYDRLGIPFYAVLGNHDWDSPDSPAAEVLFSSSSWHMPATRYSFTAGPAQFFAIDTSVVSEAELAWLDEALARSHATWKIVYGHHPIRSAGPHGDNPLLVRKLLPILAGRAQLYLAGHDHTLQHLASERGVAFVVAGAGGADLYALRPGAQPLFGSGSAYGFAVLDIEERSLEVQLVGEDLSVLHSFTIEAPRGAPPSAQAR